MKIKKIFAKHLLLSLFCFTILIPTVPITNQPSSSKDPVAPYSDSPAIYFEH